MKSMELNHKDFIRLEYGFREWLSLLGYAGTSVYGIPNSIREFLAWLEQNRIFDINNITSDHVNEYFETLRHRINTRREGGLSNSYLNKHSQALKRFSTYLRETSGNGFSVEIKTIKQERNIKDVLTIKEVQLLFDATNDTALGLRDRVMLSIYYGCGLRRNEGIQMDTDDILFDRKLLYIRKGKNYTERYVPVREKIIKYIADYINSGRTALIRESHSGNAFLLSERGERINGQSLLLRLKQLKEATGDTELMQKNIGLHSLRHSIATHLLMQGMKLERIAQFLGHKSLESTQVYAHTAAELEGK
ncbi:MAG: tyrosine-type recombinase/integrase [Bacteroidales bacterium]|jgi:integrase/recombinase XerD